VYRVYAIDLVINDTSFSEVWIDPHYEENHKESINDQLILNLLELINHRIISAKAESKGFQFFEVDVQVRYKVYRLILVIPPDNSYLGVRNAYRRSK
jgi:hypothetical protein